MTKFKLVASTGTAEFSTEWELPQTVTMTEWAFLEKNLKAATKLFSAVK